MVWCAWYTDCSFADIDGFRTTAGCYATSALLHQTHMHTELGKKRHTLGDTAALPDFGGQGFGLWRACFRSACPAFSTCCTCLSLRHRGPGLLVRVSAWVCLWSLEAKPKTLAICFICSRLKPPTQHQQQQQPQHTTGRYIHICYSDLGHYHFIVWHTICIKLQFSVLKGLAWLKTVSDVQKGIFYNH